MKRILSRLMLPLLLMSGCSVQKTVTQGLETDASESMKLERTRTDSLLSERMSRMMEETLEHRRLTIETSPGVPASETSLTLTPESLRDLPEGAEYTSRQGQASVSVRRTGDSLTITGKCDSIARRCTVLEAETLRRKTESDSLRRELDKARNKFDKTVYSARTESASLESEAKKSRSGWFAWLSSGFLLGVAACLAFRTIRKRLII